MQAYRALIWAFMSLLVWLSMTAPSGAQVQCTPKTQAQLLAAFSDNTHPSGITPQTMRNFVCSTSVPGGPLNLPSWATTGRPTAPAQGAFGFNTTLNTTEVWTGSTWLGNSVFAGGTVPGATIFTAAGTGVAVTNNATIGGTLTVDGELTVSAGATTINGNLTVSNMIVTAMPTSCTGQTVGTLWNNGFTVGICH